MLTYAFSAVSAGLASAARWRRVLCGAWARADAIHNKEARAAILGLRHAAAS